MGGYNMIEPTTNLTELNHQENTSTDELVTELAELGIERVKPATKSSSERNQ